MNLLLWYIAATYLDVQYIAVYILWDNQTVNSCCIKIMGAEG